MATEQHLQIAIREYPEIVEAPGNTSFRKATFKIGGKGCIAVEKDGEHATFALLEDDIEALIKQSSASIEPIRKAGSLIGIRVNLTELTAQQVKALVKMTHSRFGNK
ncbi:MAG: hypothetical protein JWR09_3750 [Mucilaginibacter sp.]|nr:hypothetical protein [Mucilaginibacter sp.]